jgi:hypothetical protein
MYPLCDENGEALYQAGQEVPPGQYIRVDAHPAREITLRAKGVLPPSYDGHVALYRKTNRSWRLDGLHAVLDEEQRLAGETA